MRTFAKFREIIRKNKQNLMDYFVNSKISIP